MYALLLVSLFGADLSFDAFNERLTTAEVALAEHQAEFARFKRETDDTIRNLQEMVDETKRDFENYRMAVQKQIGPTVMGTANEPQQDFQPYGPAQPVQAVYYSMPAAGYGSYKSSYKSRSRGYSVSAPLRSR